MLDINKKEKENIFSQYLFVGIDPGNTVALAFFDLNFNFLGFWSKRNAKLKEIIDKILEKGKPILLISDVNKTPSLILKLSDIFLINFWVPKKNLTTKYKKELVYNFLKKNNINLNLNQHELDALAGLLDYLNKNKRKIEYLKNKYKEKSIDLIKYGFIREIKEKEQKIKEEKILEKVGEELIKDEKEKIIYSLKKELFYKEIFIKKLKIKNSLLKQKLNKMKKRENKLKKQIKTEIEDKYKNKIKKLEEKINKQTKLIKNFEDVIKKLEYKEYLILYDFSLYKTDHISFISNRDLEKINREELKKFKYLVREKDLSFYLKFGKIIIAKRKEVENILEPKEDQRKKIIEFFKIYKEQRKSNFLKRSSLLIQYIVLISILVVGFLFFLINNIPKEKINIIKNYKKENSYKTLRNGIALLSIYEPVEIYLDYPINTKEFMEFYNNTIIIPFCENKILNGKVFLYYNKNKKCIETN